MTTNDAWPWLANYPAGVLAEIDVNTYRSTADVLATAFDKFRHRPAYSNMGKSLTYDEADQAPAHSSPPYLLNDSEACQGRSRRTMLPNVLQYPIAAFGILRVVATRRIVNTNPLYTARELKHQLSDSGASAIIVLDNFAATLAEVLPQVPSLKHVVTTALGDMLGFPKSLITNLVVRHVKKLVPPYLIENEVRSMIPDARRPRHAAERRHRPRRHRVPAVHGRHHRCREGRDADPPQHGREHAAGIGLAWHQPARRRRDRSTAIPLYHIFALTANCLVFMQIGGMSLMITNPRDMPGFVKELSKVKFSVITGVNTLFNGLLHTPVLKALRLPPICVLPSAAAWRYSVRSRKNGKKLQNVLWSRPMV